MSASALPHQSAPTPLGKSVWPWLLCWFSVALEGFDLVVLGAIIPTLLKTQALGFMPSSATLVATLSLVGVAIGASTVGPITDKFGRRYAIVGSVFLFSLFTVLVAFAPNIALFTLFRFIAGLALGAVMPCCLAYVSEWSGARAEILMQDQGRKVSRKRAAVTTLTMTGYHVGAVLISLIAVFQAQHWRFLVALGGIFGFILIPFLVWKLPESSHVASRQKHRPDPEAHSRLAMLFYGRIAVTTIGLWVASFMGLLLVYGLNTWLPKIMADAGYNMSDSLVMLFVLNIGAVVGLVLAGWLSDRHGTKVIVLMWFLLATASLLVLSIPMKTQLLLNIVVFITGLFVFSAQVLVYAYVSEIYSTPVRATALGLASGIGRLGAIVGPFITGALVIAGTVYPWGFYLFALVALLGFAAMLLMPRLRK